MENYQMTDSFMHNHQSALDSFMEDKAIQDLEDAGIYPLADPIINNKFVERDDVLKAFKKYKSLLNTAELLQTNYTWGDGDSLDRERVRDILLQNYNFQWTK